MPAAARDTDSVVGIDIHIVMFPTPAGEVPTPLPHPFVAKISTEISPDVKINGLGAAVVGSGTQNQPSHIALGPRFQKEPTNKGKVQMGSTSVFVNGKAAARMGDKVLTCADPAEMPNGTVMTGSPNVGIG
jgi:uncharacterized Zn-binding protein involved in type VI secretion